MNQSTETPTKPLWKQKKVWLAAAALAASIAGHYGLPEGSILQLLTAIANALLGGAGIL